MHICHIICYAFIENEDLQKSLKNTRDYQYALDMSSIVAITDQKGIIKYANDNFCKISKYSREELIGRDHRILENSAQLLLGGDRRLELLAFIHFPILAPRWIRAGPLEIR